MIIANPLYDVVFKRLMENEKVAKFFIGTLLDETIENIEVKPQELTYTDEFSGISIFRLDFVATIKTSTGEFKKVLIEIQKAKNYADLMRFRNYLAEHYKREEMIDNEKTVLPITTIYVLGFKLPEIKTACLKVERNYKDLIENKKLIKKSDFVENLTHDSYVVQVQRITGRYQTRLDKLLSVFEQTNFTDDTKITKDYVHKTDLEEMKILTDILHYSGTNPKERKKLAIEQEAWRTVEAYMGEVQKKYEQSIRDLEENKQIITEKERELTENKQIITEKEKELTENKQIIIEKEKELTEKDALIAELMRKLNKKK